jgi:hypothetical protein
LTAAGRIHEDPTRFDSGSRSSQPCFAYEYAGQSVDEIGHISQWLASQACDSYPEPPAYLNCQKLILGRRLVFCRPETACSTSRIALSSGQDHGMRNRHDEDDTFTRCRRHSLSYQGSNCLAVSGKNISHAAVDAPRLTFRPIR